MKKFKQLSLSILVASSFVVISGSTLAASGGVVNFSGKVVNTPCGISTETATQNITFNDISKAHLSTDGATSEIRDLNIDLVNCDLSAPEGSEEAFRSVTVSFTGSTNGNNNTELATVGGTGAAIVIANTGGTPLEINAAEGNQVKLDPGTNNLRYVTWVKKGTGQEVTEGDFMAVANFRLTYQ